MTFCRKYLHFQNKKKKKALKTKWTSLNEQTKTNNRDTQLRPPSGAFRMFEFRRVNRLTLKYQFCGDKNVILSHVLSHLITLHNPLWKMILLMQRVLTMTAGIYDFIWMQKSFNHFLNWVVCNDEFEKERCDAQHLFASASFVWMMRKNINHKTWQTAQKAIQFTKLISLIDPWLFPLVSRSSFNEKRLTRCFLLLFA